MDKSKIKILCVDDEPDILEILKYNLSNEGYDVLNISDALVTFHGTSAIEYAALGKPVLVADRGWYHDCDFVLFPKSKEEYANLLTQKWFELVNVKRSKANAELFAGMFYGIPKWQKDSILPDDSDRELLRDKLPDLVKNQKISINREISLIKKWINSESKVYHIFKIAKNEVFTNLI